MLRGDPSDFVRAAIRAAALAVQTACVAGCVAAAALQSDAEARFPDRGEHVVADGVRLRYVERGPAAGAAARPIVLLHGAWGGLEDWEATILDAAARRGRAIAFDRPGHGWSRRSCDGESPEAQAQVLRDACRAIGAERPVLVGFSWGGAVAAAWAAQWPGEVAGLVLVNAPTHPWGGTTDVVDLLATAPLVGEAITVNLLAPLAPVVAPAIVPRAFEPEPVPASFEASPVALAMRPAAFRANSEDVRALDANLARQAPGYGAIRCPVAFVVGEGDRIVSPEWHSLRFVAQVPQTRRIVVPGAGHQLPFAHPGACLAALDAVLAEAQR